MATRHWYFNWFLRQGTDWILRPRRQQITDDGNGFETKWDFDAPALDKEWRVTSHCKIA